jgi:hypothetical protein
VSGCHLVPVIVQASGRGRQARAGGRRPRDVTQPQDLGRGRYRRVIPDHRPDAQRRGRTVLMAVPPNTVTGPGSGVQAGESPLTWRWTLYVNLIFAGVAFVGGALLLGRQPSSARPRLDIPGVLLVSGVPA